MKVCGLTGGVGMGKSTAAELLRNRRVPVVDTDQLARLLVEPGQPALAAIHAEFGDQVIAPDGGLRRDELARIVFDSAEARKKIEVILHPRIRERWLAQIEAWRAESHPLAAVVIPLLFETGAESHFNKIVCVACSAPVQRDRLLARGWTPRQIELRLAAQWPVEQKIARSNFVLWTDGALDDLGWQLDRILARL